MANTIAHELIKNKNFICHFQRKICIGGVHYCTGRGIVLLYVCTVRGLCVLSVAGGGRGML